MKFIGKKLASKRGETLVEILVAILIIALAAGIFAAMYTASMNINLSAQKQDELFYEAVGTLEKMEESDNTTKSKGNLQYKSDQHEDSVQVEYFTQDGLSVYRSSDSGGSGGGEGDAP